jgi:peroxiredoxin
LFALSGLVRAYAAMVENAKARDAMARLLYVASQADPGLQVLERARATGITAEPKDDAPAPQRNYALVSLEKYGPSQWEPYAAPELNAVDSAGKTVSLKDYPGKNVILVFYLGTECPHCMKQLADLAAKKEDWERLDTVVLAVSSKVPQKDADEVKGLKEIPVLLADLDPVSARRFHSFDDFEEIDLHSTSLIDKEGRVYWGRYGGDPFSDPGFLLKQLEKMNARLARVQVADTKPSPPN